MREPHPARGPRRAPETRRESWLERAACAVRGVPTSAFYPEEGHRVDPSVALLCWECPVRQACLAEAMREESDLPLVWRAGYRGGLTPKQRAHAATGSTPAPQAPTESMIHTWQVRENRLIRAWAFERGYELKRLGDIPPAVRDAYWAAHPERLRVQGWSAA